MAVIVLVGTAGVVYSREQRAPDNSRPVASGAGRTGDHWHSAIGFYICGTFTPDILEAADPLGIHTHADGVVHTHPFTSRAAGKKAKLGVFFDTVKAKVNSSELDLPNQDGRSNGDKCDGKPATVQVKTWASREPGAEGIVYKGNPSDIRLTDNQLITVAFVPDGADIPRPPSEPRLDSLTDLATTPVPDELLASTTTTPGDATTTIPPGSPPTESSTVPPEVAPPSETTPPPAP
ncbi:MAG TPA: hypothetical protein VM942_07295 [Acidimicrobiales bacterium]|nr:hypothetical protein [Acidimicrobiales bacterium]